MIRTFHKYLSLVISIQLLLWTISGIYFAFNKIELIRGEQYLLNEGVSKLDLTNIKGNFNTKNINILKRLDQWILKVEGESQVYYRTFNGEELVELNEEEAMETVRQKTSLAPLMAIKINSESRGSEFRGRKLPLYKVLTESKDNISLPSETLSPTLTIILLIFPSSVAGTSTLDLSLSKVIKGSFFLICCPDLTNTSITSTFLKSPIFGTNNFFSAIKHYNFVGKTFV